MELSNLLLSTIQFVRTYLMVSSLLSMSQTACKQHHSQAVKAALSATHVLGQGL